MSDWVFDYAIKNGQPFHFVQTLSLRLADVKEIPSEATYVAYARRDLQASQASEAIPVSVIAVPPADDSPVVSEVESILGQAQIPLVLREDLPSLVDRLATVAGVNA